jgi:hypothetical protein
VCQEGPMRHALLWFHRKKKGRGYVGMPLPQGNFPPKTTVSEIKAVKQSTALTVFWRALSGWYILSRRHQKLPRTLRRRYSGPTASIMLVYSSSIIYSSVCHHYLALSVYINCGDFCSNCIATFPANFSKEKYHLKSETRSLSHNAWHDCYCH